MIKFRLLFTAIPVLLCFFSVQLAAQQPNGSFTIKGIIADESTGKPMEFATVALKKLRDSSLVSGAISPASGEFRLPDLPPGGYLLEIDFMGYEKYTSKVILKPQGSAPVTDLGTIRMKISAKMLEGAEIVADKSFVMNNIDRKTYNTEQLSVTTGGSVNDVLQNLPSIEMTAEGNISLRGNENVTILIDGRPSGLTGAGGKSLLESLPASAVDKIEVITNPSAKYDPDGISGIINIITKKNKLSGMTGNLGATSNFDKGYGGNGSLNYRKGKWNFYSTFGYNNNIRHGSTISHRETYFEDVTSILDQKAESENKNQSLNIKAGTDYSITDKSTISFSAMYTKSMQDGSSNMWYHFVGNSISADSLSLRETDSEAEDGGLDLDLAFKQYFSKPGRVLYIQATASGSVDDDDDIYKDQSYLSETVINPAWPPDIQHDFTREGDDVYTFSSDYEHPVGEDKKLEGGYKSTLRYIDNDFNSEFYDHASGQYVNDSTLTNRFLYNDGVHAVYVQYRQSVGKFGIQAGLRSEYAQRESELKNTGEASAKDYYSLFPSLFISWRPNDKWQTKVSYSRRINRPRTGQLNPFATYSDPLNINMGNPGLDPEYTDSYELEGNRTFNKWSITATLYYRYTHDPIQRYRTYDASTGIATVTYENINSSENIGLELIINGNLFKWWSITFSSNFYQNTIDASNLETDLGSSDISVSSRIFTTVKLPYKFEFQLTYSYRAPFEIPQGTMQTMQMTNLALSKKLLKDKMTVTFRVVDPFDNQKFAMDLTGPDYIEEFERRRDTRTFTLGVNWRFGELKDRDNRQKREQPPREDMDMGM